MSFTTLLIFFGSIFKAITLDDRFFIMDSSQNYQTVAGDIISVNLDTKITPVNGGHLEVRLLDHSKPGVILNDYFSKDSESIFTHNDRSNCKLTLRINSMEYFALCDEKYIYRFRINLITQIHTLISKRSIIEHTKTNPEETIDERISHIVPSCSRMVYTEETRILRISCFDESSQNQPEKGKSAFISSIQFIDEKDIKINVILFVLGADGGEVGKVLLLDNFRDVRDNYLYLYDAQGRSGFGNFKRWIATERSGYLSLESYEEIDKKAFPELLRTIMIDGKSFEVYKNFKLIEFEANNANFFMAGVIEDIPTNINPLVYNIEILVFELAGEKKKSGNFINNIQIKVNKPYGVMDIENIGVLIQEKSSSFPKRPMIIIATFEKITLGLFSYSKDVLTGKTTYSLTDIETIQHDFIKLGLNSYDRIGTPMIMENQDKSNFELDLFIVPITILKDTVAFTLSRHGVNNAIAKSTPYSDSILMLTHDKILVFSKTKTISMRPIEYRELLVTTDKLDIGINTIELSVSETNTKRMEKVKIQFDKIANFLSSPYLKLRDLETNAYEDEWAELPISRDDVYGINPTITLEGIPMEYARINYVDQKEIEFPSPIISHSFDQVVPVGSNYFFVSESGTGTVRRFLLFKCESSSSNLPQCKTNDRLQGELEPMEIVLGYFNLNEYLMILISNLGEGSRASIRYYNMDTNSTSILKLNFEIEHYLIHEEGLSGYMFFVNRNLNNLAIFSVELKIVGDKLELSAPQRIEFGNERRPEGVFFSGIKSSNSPRSLILKTEVDSTGETILYYYSLNNGYNSFNPKKTKSMKIVDKFLLICPIGQNIIIYSPRRNRLYSRDWDSSTETIFPFSEFGITDVLQFECIPEKASLQMIGRRTSDNKLLLVNYLGDIPEIASRRVHSIIELDNDVIGVNSETYGHSHTITSAIVRQEKSGTPSKRKVFYINTMGPRLMIFPKSTETSASVQPIKKTLTLKIQTGEVQLKQEFTIEVLKEIRVPKVEYIPKLYPEIKGGRMVTIDDFIDVNGPVMDSVMVSTDSKMNKYRSHSRKTFYYSYPTLTADPITWIEAKQNWIVILKKEKSLYLVNNPNNKETIFEKGLDERFSSAVIASDFNQSSFIVVGKYYTLDKDEHISYNIMIMEAVSTNQKLDIQTTSIPWDRSGGEIQSMIIKGKLAVVELDEDGLYMAVHYFEKSQGKWKQIKTNDPKRSVQGNLVDSILSKHKIAHFSTFNYNDSTFYVLFSFENSFTVIVAEFSIDKPKTLYPEVKVAGDILDTTTGYVNCKPMIGIENTIDCFVDSNSINSYLLEYTINKEANSTDQFISSVKKRQTFYKPAGFSVRKVERTNKFIAISYRSTKGKTYSQNIIPNNIYGCDHILLLYKITQSYPWVGFTCFDSNAQQGMYADFTMNLNQKNLFWITVFPKKSVSNLQPEGKASIKCFKIGYNEISFTGTEKESQSLKLNFIGLDGNVGMELNITELFKMAPEENTRAAESTFLSLLLTTSAIFIYFFGIFICYWICLKINSYSKSRNEKKKARFRKDKLAQISFKPNIKTLWKPNEEKEIEEEADNEDQSLIL